MRYKMPTPTVSPQRRAMQAQDPHYLPAAVAVAVVEIVANLEAMVDEAAVLLENADTDMDAENDISPIHQDSPIAIWTIIPPKNAESYQNRPATPLE